MYIHFCMLHNAWLNFKKKSAWYPKKCLISWEMYDFKLGLQTWRLHTHFISATKWDDIDKKQQTMASLESFIREVPECLKYIVNITTPRTEWDGGHINFWVALCIFTILGLLAFCLAKLFIYTRRVTYKWKVSLSLPKFGTFCDISISHGK